MEELKSDWFRELPLSVAEVLMAKKFAGKVRMSKEEYEKYKSDFEGMKELDQFEVRKFLNQHKNEE